MTNGRLIIEAIVPGAPLRKGAKHPKVWAAPVAGLAQNAPKTNRLENVPTTKTSIRKEISSNLCPANSSKHAWDPSNAPQYIAEIYLWLK